MCNQDKKTILFIPAWYPSKEKPLEGTFFKEQADFLAEHYNVVVLIIERVEVPILQYSCKVCKGEKYSFNHVRTYGNLREYKAKFYESSALSFIQKMKPKAIAQYMKKTGYEGDAFEIFQRREMKYLYPLIMEPIDVVYGISCHGIAFQAALLAKYLKKPLVFGEHKIFPFPRQLLTDIEIDSIEQADCFMAISIDKIRQFFMQQIKLKRIEYVGNLTDEKMFLCAPQQSDTKTLLIVAARTYLKNYDMFIEVMNRLAKKTKNDFRVIIAGYNSFSGYCTEIDEFEKLIHLSDFADRVELIPQIARGDMPQLYNRADAFVLTSIEEGQPCSVLEAACCGLPIFSTICGGVEDYVDNRMGRLVDITNVDGMVENLRQFVDGEISFDSNYIREKVVSRFGREAFGKRMIEIFDSVIKQ